MAEILEVLIANVAIWVPSLVSVLSVIGAVVGVCAKGAAAVQQIKNSTQFAQLKASNIKLTKAVEDQNKSIALLTDKLAKIEGYSDAKINSN